MKCKVNKKLLPGKIAFFGMVSAGTWTAPYMMLFFQHLGLTTTECSIILGCQPISSGFFKLIVGAVADKLQRHREMTLLFALIAAFLTSCLLLVPHVEEEVAPTPDWNGTLHYKCKNNEQTPVICTVTNASSLHPEIDKTGLTEEEWIKTKTDEFANFSDCQDKLGASFQVLSGCWKDMQMAQNGNNSDKEKFVCQLDCTAYPEAYLNPTKPKKDMFGKTFMMVFCLSFTGSMLSGSLWTLLYGMNYAVLGEDRNKFGRQRMWGTCGALTNSILTAIAMNKYGSVSPEITYIPCFVGNGIWLAVAGVAAMFFKLPYMARNRTMARDMFKLAKQPRIFLLFTVLFIMGFLFSGDNFLFVFLGSLGTSSWTLGVILFVRFSGEIPALYFSPRIIKKIGHAWCIYIVLIAYSIRWLGTSFITNPWWEIPFSLFNSIVFGFGFTAVSVYSSLITPPSMHATLQAMVQTMHFGLGASIGIFVLGPTMDVTGYRWGFRLASVISIVTFVLYAIIQRFLPPVKLVTHDEDGDDDKNAEVKEPLKDENGEVKKPLEMDNNPDIKRNEEPNKN